MSQLRTIAAIATAPAPSGVAIIRISGEETKAVVSKIIKNKSDKIFQKPRELHYVSIINQSGSTLDQGLAVYMPGPKSFTGEDVIELHLHGSPYVCQQVLRNLFEHGATPAEPGEFSKRAFLNNKLDLTQAEAIADIINSNNERALTIAQEQLNGKLSKAIETLGEPLKDILAEIEATIDFPDEDILPDTKNKMISSINKTLTSIQGFIESFNYGSMLKDGFKLLLCGSPNVGKSSLFNLLLSENKAIVSSVSGTTRDLIEVHLTFGKYSFILCDSAGLTETEDEVEKIGVELTKSRLDWADCVLYISDISKPKTFDKDFVKTLKEKNPNILFISNKSDLKENSQKDKESITISTKTNSGIAELKTALINKLESTNSDLSATNAILTNERHYNCLKKAATSIEETLNTFSKELPLEFVSAELRRGLNHLEEIVGKTNTEDILGRIFSKFCIGK